MIITLIIIFVLLELLSLQLIEHILLRVGEKLSHYRRHIWYLLTPKKDVEKLKKEVEEFKKQLAEEKKKLETSEANTAYLKCAVDDLQKELKSVKAAAVAPAPIAPEMQLLQNQKIQELTTALKESENDLEKRTAELESMTAKAKDVEFNFECFKTTTKMQEESLIQELDEMFKAMAKDEMARIQKEEERVKAEEEKKKKADESLDSSFELVE